MVLHSAQSAEVERRTFYNNYKMSDDDSSQENGVMFDEAAGGGVLDDMGDGGVDKAQILQAHAARKRAKLSKQGGSSSKRKSSSSNRTRPVVKLLVTSVSRSYSEPWRRRQQRESSGTGFLISWRDNEDGDGATKCDNREKIRIVTNAHVIRNASTVRARASFGPHVVSCEVEWQSLPLDLALLKIAEGDWDDFCKGWNFDDLLTSNDDSGGNNSGDKESAASNVDDGAAAPSDAAVATASANNNGGSKNAAAKTGSNKPLTLSAGLPKLDENVTCVGFPQGGTQISVTRGVVSRIDVDSLYVLRIQIDAAINPGE